MKACTDLSDSRLMTTCVYCGGLPETRDHVPSRVLLDDPFPDNLPVVAACGECNSGFSLDEEYLACLLDIVLTGSTVATSQMRPKVQKILNSRSSLADRIKAGRVVDLDRVLWTTEIERVEKIVMKLAQGHAAFELSQPHVGTADRILIIPMPLMTKDQCSVHGIRTCS